MIDGEIEHKMGCERKKGGGKECNEIIEEGSGIVSHSPGRIRGIMVPTMNIHILKTKG